MHKFESPETSHPNGTPSTANEQPRVAISRALEIIIGLQQNSKSPEVTQLAVIIQAKLLQLQDSGINYVSGAIRVMLEGLGKRPNLSLAEITRVFTEKSIAANDEKYPLAV